MSTKQKSENTWLDEIFLDDAIGLFTQNENAEPTEINQETTPSEKFSYPTLLAEESAAEDKLMTYWRTLRAFFRTGKGGGLPVENGQLACRPALLAPYLATKHSGPFPCWIDTESQANSKPELVSVRALIEQKIAEFAPGKSEGSILKDNISRLDRIVKKQLADFEQPQAPKPLLEEALDEFVLQLDLKGQEGEAFLADLNQLRKLLPATGLLIPLSPYAPFHLLAVLMDFQVRNQREALKQEIEPLVGRIRQLLDVERSKDPSARSASSLKANMEFAGSFLNFDELAAVMPSAGSVAMPEERMHRLEQILETLENAGQALEDQRPYVLIANRLTKKCTVDLPALFSQAVVEIVPDEKAYQQAANLFDQKIQAYSSVFAAIRIARLELDEQYQHEVHGDLFAYFSHSDFNETEMALCPPFILAVHSAELVHFGLNDFSALLASNRPVKCLALKFDALGHVAPPDKGGKADPVFRQEPGALALVHRDSYVLQSTIADPARLFGGFWEGLTNLAPAFFYVQTVQPGRKLPGGNFVWGSAATGGREFPFFTYDNRKGPKWGSRFDISGNPGIDNDWPEETLLYEAQDAGIQKQACPFTFADFAALDPAFERFFNLVPAACWTDDLVPLADYLQLPAADAYRKIPFIWMVDAKNQLQKAAVAMSLVQTCLERLDFWHFLQENAGVHSFHVEQATEQLRREFEAQLEQKITELSENHTRELEQVRETTARDAMEQLADFLLELNTTAMLPASSGRPISPVQKPPVDAEQSPAAGTSTPKEAKADEAPKAESPALAAEAWIETPLCTTCNECINLNDRIFKYNADKQAYVADPAGGPFVDIVKAAEECPVSIIHPGTPLNPNEPGLDALIKRAAKFN